MIVAIFTKDKEHVAYGVPVICCGENVDTLAMQFTNAIGGMNFKVGENIFVVKNQ